MYSADSASFYESEDSGERPPQPLSGPYAGSRAQEVGSYETNPPVAEPVLNSRGYSRPDISASHQTPHTDNLREDGTRRDPVVGHIGRLVSNDDGVSMFAGSSTGVHFISQAEQHMQKLRIYDHTFPSSIYGLHLRNIWGPQT